MLINLKRTYKIWLKMTHSVVSVEKHVLIFICKLPKAKVLNSHIPLLTQLVFCIWHLSQATTVSENLLFSLFATEKPKPYKNLTLPLDRSRSTQGHNLIKL